MRAGQSRSGFGTFRCISASELTMRLPTASRIVASAVILCAGIVIFPAYKLWTDTRTWVALDMPVSLAPGHIKANDFYINVNATYSITFTLTEYESPQNPACNTFDTLRTRWWLTRDAKVVATWQDYWGDYWNASKGFPAPGNNLGYFDSTKGRYDLDVEVASDASCLQEFHPRLTVWTYNGDYVRNGSIYDAVILLSWALIGISVAFALTSAAEPIPTRVVHGESLPIFARLREEREAAPRKLLLMGPASVIPTIAYFLATFAAVLLLIFAPFRLVQWQRSRGVPARLVRPGMTWENDRYGTGILVYVRGNGEIYLNSRLVSAQELPGALEDAFLRNGDWSAYVEADQYADFQNVARAMAEVREAHGKVFLLTPGTRAQFEAGRH